jgi:beta-glucosidase
MHKKRSRPRNAARAAAAFTVSAALVASGAGLATAATTNPNPGALEREHAALSERAATEGMVLLENNDHALPIRNNGNIAVFGVGAYATVKGGTGSGAVNNRDSVSVRQGLEAAGYSVTTSDEYYDAMVDAYETEYGGGTGGGIFGPTIDYSSVEQALTQQSARPTSATDTAVYVVARNSGEGTDRTSGSGDYELADVERANLEVLGSTYAHVVVLLNVGGVVDTSFFDEVNADANDPDGGMALDALLLMSQAGQESGTAVTEVLNGTVTPSGKLTDTWASDYSYYPAADDFASNDGDSLHEEYDEGIYVGYRYFDSLYKSIDAADPASVVNYPFGFGLSYTDFQVEPQSVTADMGSVTVKARVTNVGDTYSGKEVVEVYVSAPTTGLDKPYQQLTGYAKTDELAPGDSQTVTIGFRTTDLASYDQERAAYVLEKGDYLIRVGDSSRNTRVASRLRLAETTVTEQLANELDDDAPESELTSEPSDFYSYPTESAETAAAPVISLDTTGFTAAQNASEYEQDVAVDASSPYFAIDRNLISTTTAYLDEDTRSDWEGTGAAYPVKTGESVEYVETDPSATLFDVAKGDTTLEEFVAGLSVRQLANIVEGGSVAGSTLTAVGAAGYTTGKYEALGLPVMTLADGPAGLRLTQRIASTPASYQFATAWPIGTLLAQTWDRELVEDVAAAIGAEMAEYGVTLWLAPGMNIHRDPLNGRNFEYYSEDPLVTGLTAAAMTAGVQSEPGVGVTIKHYAANNQETSRNTTNAVISERASREIYLRGFQIAVESAQPMAVMTSYNRINGSYASGDYDLVTDILRGEWGFDGMVMTDWGAGPRTGAVGVMYAGNDLIEPGNNAGEIINNTLRVAPAIDVAGLPVYNRLTTQSNNRTTYQWSFNGLTPSATGTEVISTTVDADTDLSQPLSGSTVRNTINNETFTANAPYASVQAAYQDVTSLLAGSALTAAQKAGITVTDVVHATPGDDATPVVSYTVNVRGSYSTAGYAMRLGDLQRSAMRILDLASKTAVFEQLASLQGVAGISAQPYTATFDDLTEFVSSSTGRVVQDQVGSGPGLELGTATAPSASGWFTSPVRVTATSEESAQVYIDVDSGELRPYVDPVTVSGDGIHSVRALAVGDDGSFSTLKELTVRIDGVAPTVAATGTGGTLTLTAQDAVSGVASTEYSTDGRTWQRYSAPVPFEASTAVSYRATDVAGNTSATATVTVSPAAKTDTKVTAKLVDRTITRKNHGVVKVRVKPVDEHPTGKVVVHYGSKTKTVKLTASDDGTLRVTLPKLKKGTVKVWAKYTGSSAFTPDASPKIKLKVR